MTKEISNIMDSECFWLMHEVLKKGQKTIEDYHSIMKDMMKKNPECKKSKYILERMNYVYEELICNKN